MIFFHCSELFPLQASIIVFDSSDSDTRDSEIKQCSVYVEMSSSHLIGCLRSLLAQISLARCMNVSLCVHLWGRPAKTNGKSFT